ncbi:hypothetical protein ApDm4_0516 [Acetobacter pomorum]|nr:hypothetical protein ApDm4_0516 [Acetobacter pomorum]
MLSNSHEVTKKTGKNWHLLLLSFCERTMLNYVIYKNDANVKHYA